jgi:hypothetical protein
MERQAIAIGERGSYAVGYVYRVDSRLSALFTPITYGQSNQSGPITGGIAQNQNQPVLGPDEARDPQGYQKGEGYLPVSPIQWKQQAQYGGAVKPDKLSATVGCSHNDGDTIGPGLVPSGSNAHWQRVIAEIHRTANGSTLEIYYLEDRQGNVWSTRPYTVNGVPYPANAGREKAELIKLTPQYPPGPCLPSKAQPNTGTTGMPPQTTYNIPSGNTLCTIYIDVEGCPWHMPMHVHCDGSDQQAWTAEESKDAYQYTRAQWTHPQVCNPCPPPPCVYTIDPWFGQFMGPAPG